MLPICTQVRVHITHTRLKTQTESPYTDSAICLPPAFFMTIPPRLSFLTARACQQAQKQGDVCVCGGHVLKTKLGTHPLTDVSEAGEGPVCAMVPQGHLGAGLVDERRPRVPGGSAGTAQRSCSKSPRLCSSLFWFGGSPQSKRERCNVGSSFFRRK